MSKDFQKLLARMRHGDQDAARALYEEYGALLSRVVRRHLNSALRSHFDSIDFVQETWLEFLKDMPATRTFETPSKLAKYLTTIARNKVIASLRRGLMRGFAGEADISLDSDEVIRDNLRGTHSTPSQAAMGKELFEFLTKDLRPVHQEIGRMLLRGLSVEEIVEVLGVGQRMVERVRVRLIEKLSEL